MVNSSRLVTSDWLDREATPSASFTIKCQVFNDSLPILNETRDFTLLITDENDNPPHLQGPEDQIFHIYLRDRAVIGVRENFWYSLT